LSKVDNFRNFEIFKKVFLFFYESDVSASLEPPQSPKKNLKNQESYRYSFSLQLEILELRQCPVGVLAPVHANERAASRRDQVNRNNVAILPKSVRQLFLMHQLGEMADPQSRTAHCKRRTNVLRFLKDNALQIT